MRRELTREARDMHRMQPSGTQATIRSVGADEVAAALAIINAAAEAYRGVIPDDCWSEPYMSDDELRSEIAAGVAFAGCEIDGALAGVMGAQRVRNVTLIRHAYVSPAHQGQGVGSALLVHACERLQGPVLIGTWAAAAWAIRFYERHGFELVPTASATVLLSTYWTVSPRQIETSVVLTRPALNDEGVAALINA
jgi:GNAT superfamily N-acetyltransferase